MIPDDISGCVPDDVPVEVLDGAVKIVYPMGLPPYDPVRQELGECKCVSRGRNDQKRA